MNTSCFILRRADTHEYYKGAYHRLVDRFGPLLSKAKKYKRSCDAANAVTTMNSWAKVKDWGGPRPTFIIEEYELKKVGERAL